MISANMLSPEYSGYSKDFKNFGSLNNFKPDVECKRIVEFIREAIIKYNFKGAVLGVSGGIDSAVVLALLLKALGKDKIKILILPERDSSKESLKDAIYICNHFDVNYEIFNISGVLRKLDVYSLFPPAFLIPEKFKEIYSKNRWKRYEDAYIMDLKNEGDELFLK
ncbi:MAG: hypothetical protein ACK4MM_06530, partial [Fervidobacterium sp.]